MRNSPSYFAIALLFLFALRLDTSAETASLKNLHSWGYLLQNVTVAKVKNSPFELVVIEPQLEEDNTRTFSRQSVQQMKQIAPGKKKRIVLAYLSIGEAEDYRAYWQSSWKEAPPPWLGKLNPDWEGNYKVRFWFAEWQQILLQQLEAILASGFDGIYLDIVDAWQYWSDGDTYSRSKELKKPGDPEKDQKKAARLMLEWLQSLGDYARTKSPNHNSDFYIIPQNGEGMLDFLTEPERNRFWKLVDGIGVESLFFYGEKPENNSLNIEKERLKWLRQFKEKDKTVLVIEYLTEPNLICEFYTLANQHRFLPYAGVKMLDRLVSQVPPNLVQ